MPARQPDRDAYDRLADLVARMSPEELRGFALTLSPEDLSVLEDAVGRLTARGWRTHPAAMANQLTGGTYQRWAYIDYLSQKFVDAIEGRSPRQIWNLAPRYGKTGLLQWCATWALDRRPDARLILVGYGDDLAVESALAVRDNLREHADVLRAQLRPDRQRADRFVTDQGGGVLARGINSGIIGFGVGDGGALLLDDPMKSWAEAHSQAARNKLAGQFFGTLRNRLDSEDTPIIVAHARWHEDDISGRLQDQARNATGEDWEVVRLPTLAETDDPLGRREGEPLAPEMHPLAAVLSRNQGYGSPYLVAALEQQRPSPEAGNELLREWFRLEHVLPSEPAASLSSWDLKLKNREAGDFVVGQAWWRVAGGYWLMDQLRGQWDHGTTADAIALLAVRHPEIQEHVVEAAGSADEVIPQLRMARPGHTISDTTASKLGMSTDERIAVEGLRRRGMSGLVPQPPRQSKEVRARAFIAPAAAAGDIHLPADAYWAPVVLEELAAFPNGSHDDIVDAMSQALSRLAHGPSSFATVSGQRLPVASPGSGRRRLPTPGRR